MVTIAAPRARTVRSPQAVLTPEEVGSCACRGRCRRIRAQTDPMVNPLATARMRPVTVTVTCPHPAPPVTGRTTGLSPLAGRILDQLSITAWLPAGLLMANTYLVAGMYLVQVPGSEPSAHRQS